MMQERKEGGSLMKTTKRARRHDEGRIGIFWTCVFWILAGSFLSVFPGVLFADVQEDFQTHCERVFQESGKCPEDICRMECVLTQKDKDCDNVCFPKECLEISAEVCPASYCAVMVN